MIIPITEEQYDKLQKAVSEQGDSKTIHLLDTVGGLAVFLINRVQRTQEGEPQADCEQLSPVYSSFFDALVFMNSLKSK